MIFVLALTVCGCAMMQERAKKQEEAKVVLEKKKQSFLDLEAALKTHELKAGATVEAVTSRYGAPDDTFGSSSEVSSFQVLTYEYPVISEKDTYQPMRLYFSDGKLAYWSN